MFAVQNTPDEVVKRLSIAMDNIMKSPEVKKKINDMGLIPAAESNSNSFQIFVNEEIDRWKQVFLNYRFDIPVLR